MKPKEDDRMVKFSDSAVVSVETVSANRCAPGNRGLGFGGSGR